MHGLERETGGRLTKVVEPEALSILREYELLWKRQKVDLSKLAKLRWIEKWKLPRIARELGVGVTTVRFRLKDAGKDLRVMNFVKGHDLKFENIRGW